MSHDGLKSDIKIGGDSNFRSKSGFSSANFVSAQHSEAIFERMIIIIPYRSGDYVKKIESSFERINLKGLCLSNSRYLSTKELTPEDRSNRKLNFLGCFELIDKEMRCYVLEGLGGVGNCMDEFYRENERETPNNKKFKMLYNPEIRFKDRIY